MYSSALFTRVRRRAQLSHQSGLKSGLCSLQMPSLQKRELTVAREPLVMLRYWYAGSHLAPHGARTREWQIKR